MSIFWLYGTRTAGLYGLVVAVGRELMEEWMTSWVNWLLREGFCATEDSECREDVLGKGS